MDEGGFFSGETDNLMRWLSGAGILIGLACAAVLFTVLLRNPNWRVSAAAKWTLLVGLFLLPAVTMLFGNVVGFHKVKNSCTQCHTMDPWVADMKDPKSTTLVSKHYQNRWIPDDQCYTCLHCHGESAKYLKIDQHVDGEFKPKILSGEMSCFECHTAPHPRKKP